MRFHKMLLDNKFSLVVSLPENSLTLAKAALAGGAQAIKVHCNVSHRASGHNFGTYNDNKAFLKDLIALCGSVPVGLVPGGGEAFISDDERLELEAMGLDFFSVYADHLPPFMMNSKMLSKMVALDSTYTSGMVDAVRHSEIDVLECSIQPGEKYATPLRYDDILRYIEIVQNCGKPCIVPTQRAILPSEVHHLHTLGCKGIMIGAIVIGKEPTAEDCKKVTAEFREAIESL